MRTGEQAITAEMEKTARKLARQRANLLAAQGRRLMGCQNKKCARKSRLSKWIFIVNHHYIQPYSCNGGDYWVRSNRGEVLTCPHCGHEHRRVFLEKAMSEEDFKVAEIVAGHLLHRYENGNGNRDSLYVYR